MALLRVQDIVVADPLPVCHMEREHAEACLPNLPRLVKPGGYFFGSD
jgi:hypothetical protein